jgi:hypothetical protein
VDFIDFFLDIESAELTPTVPQEAVFKKGEAKAGITKNFVVKN